MTLAGAVWPRKRDCRKGRRGQPNPAARKAGRGLPPTPDLRPTQLARLARTRTRSATSLTASRPQRPPTSLARAQRRRGPGRCSSGWAASLRCSAARNAIGRTQRNRRLAPVPGPRGSRPRREWHRNTTQRPKPCSRGRQSQAAASRAALTQALSTGLARLASQPARGQAASWSPNASVGCPQPWPGAVEMGKGIRRRRRRATRVRLGESEVGMAGPACGF